ncbi:helix-turn-helix transcriptional regulator [Salegentibacter sp. JZCK2]|uniref:response regulator transcription factor n=1 Tax=Salegentibacter tibetensis TaxID=2873600 RepID=UPI001CCA98D5|nr:helix-turn-helix transcriptional regulator [Salegentibacter tibetensis]MBZ9729373.1 helix-turn-helix transcriptional regulator [Salegentibacter tibetensis]
METDSAILEEKMELLKETADFMPCVVVVHQLEPFTPIYMSEKGLSKLGIKQKELQEIGADYHKRFFNNEDMTNFLKKMEALLANQDPEETFSFFQQVKFKKRKEWVWHLSSVRIFHQSKDGIPTHTCTTAIPIDQMKHIPNKAERLLAENMFFNQNLEHFLNLGDREKEVLKLVAMGESSVKIAEKLFISVETVSTHRKNIKQKLGIKSSYEFTKYAYAFDLI